MWFFYSKLRYFEEVVEEVGGGGEVEELAGGGGGGGGEEELGERSPVDETLALAVYRVSPEWQELGM